MNDLRQKIREPIPKTWGKQVDKEETEAEHKRDETTWTGTEDLQNHKT
jgi:hypothetical protein